MSSTAKAKTAKLSTFLLLLKFLYLFLDLRRSRLLSQALQPGQTLAISDNDYPPLAVTVTHMNVHNHLEEVVSAFLPVFSKIVIIKHPFLETAAWRNRERGL